MTVFLLFPSSSSGFVICGEQSPETSFETRHEIDPAFSCRRAHVPVYEQKVARMLEARLEVAQSEVRFGEALSRFSCDPWSAGNEPARTGQDLRGYQ